MEILELQFYIRKIKFLRYILLVNSSMTIKQNGFLFTSVSHFFSFLGTATERTALFTPELCFEVNVFLYTTVSPISYSLYFIPCQNELFSSSESFYSCNKLAHVPRSHDVFVIIPNTVTEWDIYLGLLCKIIPLITISLLNF